ncbi:MAG TPA: hypothetical protein VK508_10195 [Cyclobacteriaceae bacterium]|nr:hypothetical protein [Cyclobacteriaceae bacterium]
MKAKLILVAAATILLSYTGHAQVGNRLKNKVAGKGEQKAGEAIDNLFSGKKKNQNSGTNGTNGGNANGQSNTGSSSGSNGSNNNPSNNSGGGLISTPPDVKQNLVDAETAYKKSSYGEARYAVQQAMLGVELEIGNNILKSLPESLGGLKKQVDADQVTSTGYGWAGLTIHREYNDTKDKEIRVTIANNSAWMAGVNAYLTNGGYAQQTNGQQNWKQTKVKGNRAIIEYDESSGYKLSVPLGQSSLIVYEGVNIASEGDMIKAAEGLDIDGIKKQLGEQ